MITKNTIHKYFQDLADNHYQLKYFGYGDLSEVSVSEAVTYPLLWVTPTPSNVSGNTITYNYNIVVADRLEDGDLNKVEVESDTHQICLDILASFRQNTEFDWELDKSSNFTPFIHRFKDQVCGHLMTLSFEVEFNYNECAIPQSGTPQPPYIQCESASVSINSVPFTTIESGALGLIEVRNDLGVLVGSEILGVWVVPSGGGCADATAVLKDETGNILSSTNIPSGTSQDIIAPDGVATAKNSEGTILSTLSIDSGGAGDLNIGDSSAVIKDSGGNILKTELIPAETSSDVLITDSSVDNSDASYSVLVLAEGSLVLPDSQINVNSVDIGDVVSVKTIDVNLSDGIAPVVPVSSILTGNTLAITLTPSTAPSGILFNFPKGQQYTSYRTGDEGYRNQNGFFDIVRPTDPLVKPNLNYSLGANFWYEIDTPLTVGGVSSQTRFVDVTGLQNWLSIDNQQTFLIDKYTGLGYLRRNADLSSASFIWADAVDLAYNFSITVNGILYPSNTFYLPSLEEYLLIGGHYLRNGWTDPYTAKVLVVNSAQVDFWASTTQAINTNNAWSINPNPGMNIRGWAKTQTGLLKSSLIFDARALITI
jgi:hypothetical protein